MKYIPYKDRKPADLKGAYTAARRQVMDNLLAMKDVMGK